MDKESPSRRPKEIQEILATELKIVRDRKGSDTPAEMPEVRRELTMLRGATISVQRAAALLVALVEPILSRPATELMGDTADAVCAGLPPAVLTDVGQEMREIQDSLSELERFLLTAGQSVAL